MLRVIADTSIVFGWFHEEGEEDVGASRMLLRSYGRGSVSLAVLDLTRLELGNAMLRGRARSTSARTIAVLDSLAIACPVLTTDIEDLRRAARLAEQQRLTFYDATYAAVARSRGAELATLDKALLEAGLGRRPSEIVAMVEA